MYLLSSKGIQLFTGSNCTISLKGTIFNTSMYAVSNIWKQNIYRFYWSCIKVMNLSFIQGQPTE